MAFGAARIAYGRGDLERGDEFRTVMEASENPIWLSHLAASRADAIGAEVRERERLWPVCGRLSGADRVNGQREPTSVPRNMHDVPAIRSGLPSRLRRGGFYQSATRASQTISVWSPGNTSCDGGDFDTSEVWQGLMVEDVDRRIGTTFARLASAAATARSVQERYLDDLLTGHHSLLLALERDLANERREAEVAHQSLTEALSLSREQADNELTSQITAIVATDPWSIAAFDDPAWQSYQPVADAVATAGVRIGAVDLGEAGSTLTTAIPAVAQVLGDRHVLISASGDGLVTARSLLSTVVLRLVTAAAPGAVRLALADPLGHGRHLSAFLRLPASLRVGDRVAVSPRELEELLGTLADHVVEVSQTRLTNVYDTIEEYNAETTGVAVPYHVLAMTDFPAGCTERSAELLVGLARSGPRAGVHLVVSVDRSAELPRGFSLADLSATATTLRLKKGELTWDDPDFGNYPVIPDRPPAAERVNVWLDAVGTAALEISDRLPFDRIAVPASEHWTGNSTNGLEVQIGVDSRGEPQCFIIGRGRVHHALVGADVQMGKSNLLQVLVTQLALRYPPEELELYLLDFKEVEFDAFLTHRLPHARSVASRADREFGLSVLRLFRAEIDRRSELFRNAEVPHLRAYRQETGQPLPRALVVMDEFQVLFPDHDRLSVKAGALLEDIARRGAGFGLHLLMCSQSPSSGQAITYLRPMYEQMALRIALGCRQVNVSYAILGEGNDAATRLHRPGDAIYDDRGGDATHSPAIRIAELPNRERRAWLQTISALAGDRRYPPPAAFDPAASAHLYANPVCAELLAAPDWPVPGSTVDAWLGDPVEIKAATCATFERDVRSNLLVVADQEAGYRLLTSTLLSIAVQRSPADVDFAVADFARSTSPFRGFFADLAGHLPHNITIVGPRAAVPALDDLLLSELDVRAAAPTDRHPSRFFLIAGLHRWQDLEGQYGQRSEVAERLARLADEGPELGLHVVVWSESAGAVERALGRDGLRLFYLRVATRVSEPDSLALFGAPVAARLQDNRALFRLADSEPGMVEKFKPYAMPDMESFARLALRPSGTREVQ